VVLGGHFPIDAGRRAWDKRPLLGSSKTWLGLLGGMSAGMLCAVLEAHLLMGTSWDLWAGQADWYLASGFLLSAGALAGDLLGSFAKRRLNLGAGEASWLLDQLPFVLVAMLAVLPLGITFQFELVPLAFLLIITVLLHRSANWLAHRSGLKKVPW